MSLSAEKTVKSRLPSQVQPRQAHNIRVAHKLITTLRRLLADREQYTRSNAATARLLILVRQVEILARERLNTNGRQEMVM